MKLRNLIPLSMLGITLTMAAPSTSQASASSPKQDSNVVTIYLARHGETTGNDMELAEGWDDYPLTPKGNQVAEDVGAGLRGIKFTDAACGKLVRHLDTIKDMLVYSGNGKVTVNETPLLREAGNGEYELDNYDQEDALLNNYYKADSRAALQKKFGIDFVAKMHDALYQIDKNSTKLPKADRAESGSAIIKREAKGIKEVADRTAKDHGKKALVVSSGDIITAYLSKYDHNLSAADKKLLTDEAMPNSGITKVYYNVKTNKIKFGKVGDTSYVNKGIKYLKDHKVTNQKTIDVKYAD